ncbi:MAG: hypothetical protein WBC26_07870 [Alphaproteobacteria bacterium]
MSSRKHLTGKIGFKRKKQPLFTMSAKGRQSQYSGALLTLSA